MHAAARTEAGDAIIWLMRLGICLPTGNKAHALHCAMLAATLQRSEAPQLLTNWPDKVKTKNRQNQTQNRKSGEKADNRQTDQRQRNKAHAVHCCSITTQLLAKPARKSQDKEHTKIRQKTNKNQAKDTQKWGKGRQQAKQINDKETRHMLYITQCWRQPCSAQKLHSCLPKLARQSQDKKQTKIDTKQEKVGKRKTTGKQINDNGTMHMLYIAQCWRQPCSAACKTGETKSRQNNRQRKRPTWRDCKGVDAQPCKLFNCQCSPRHDCIGQRLQRRRQQRRQQPLKLTHLHNKKVHG
jgi:hypothetical protein